MRDYNISWQEYEYEFYEKSIDWFWALGIITISVAITAIVLNNLLFALLIIVGSIALSIYAVREPDLVYYEINQRGVMVGNHLYPYSSLDSFWINHNGEKSELLISSKKLLMPHIVIPINEEVDTELLRDYLLDRVDEEEQREPISTHLMKYFGF